MTFNEFKKEYEKTFNLMMSYHPNQCGSSHFAEKLGNLEDLYPDFALMLEDDLEAS